MYTDWFSTPGPRHFLEQLFQDLGQGCSVVLHVSKMDQNRLNQVLHSEMMQTELWVKDLDEAMTEPFTDLQKKFGCFRPGDIWDSGIGTLYKAADFPGRIFFTDQISDKNWSSWELFLGEFSHYNRSIPKVERSAFLLLVDLSIPANRIKEDVMLRFRNYNGYADSLDMMIHALSALENHSGSVISRHLMANLCVELALWDSQLCERLASESLEVMTWPMDLLVSYAREYDWFERAVLFTLEEKRYHGISMLINDKEEDHSAYLAVRNDRELIAHRIWRAQVTSLFRLLEPLRRKLIKQYESILKVPHTGADGVLIQNKEDLDIGHIAYQLKNHPTLNIKNKRQLESLRVARNALAHGDALTYEETQNLLEVCS